MNTRQTYCTQRQNTAAGERGAIDLLILSLSSCTPSPLLSAPHTFSPREQRVTCRKWPLIAGYSCSCLTNGSAALSFSVEWSEWKESTRFRWSGGRENSRIKWVHFQENGSTHTVTVPLMKAACTDTRHTHQATGCTSRISNESQCEWCSWSKKHPFIRRRILLTQ